MRISRSKYYLGRYKNKKQGNTVNLYMGVTPEGWDCPFYYYRYKKIVTCESLWDKVGY